MAITVGIYRMIYPLQNMEIHAVSIGYDLLSWTLPVTVPRHQQCKIKSHGALERKITYCILIYKYLWIFQLATFDYQRRHT